MRRSQDIVGCVDGQRLNSNEFGRCFVILSKIEKGQIAQVNAY